MEFSPGYYDAVVVPQQCGYFKQVNKNDGTVKRYFRLAMQYNGQTVMYPYWMSGGAVPILQEALQTLGVPDTVLGVRDFYKAPQPYINAIPCRFRVDWEEYNGERKLKIKGVFFGDGAKPVDTDEDAEDCMRILGPLPF